MPLANVAKITKPANTAETAPTLSIIIPVYNGSKHIDRLLKKLLKHRPDSSEIIVVENGSSDDSYIKLKNYQSNLILLHTDQNFGVSHARNLGLAKSTGTFFTFLDIDDDFEPAVLTKMLERITSTSADLCVANYDELSAGQKTDSKYNYADFDSLDHDTALKLFLTDRIAPAVWDKIYRRTVFADLKFDKTLSIGEDILYILGVFQRAEHTVFLNDIYYHYIQHPHSAMHTVTDRLLDFLKVPGLAKNTATLAKNFPTEWNYFELEMYTRAFHSISSNYKTDRKTCLVYLKKLHNRDTLRRIQKHPHFPKSIKLECKIYQIFGARLHLFLMPLYNVMRRVSRRKNV